MEIAYCLPAGLSLSPETMANNWGGNYKALGTFLIVSDMVKSGIWEIFKGFMDGIINFS